MKKLCTLTLLSLLAFAQLNGQSVQLENVTREGFQGLEYLGDDGYYVQYIEGVTGNLKKAKKHMRLIALDNDLKVNTEFSIEIKPEEKIEDVAYNGENFMVIYSNYSKANKTLKVVDKNGVEKSSKVLEKIKRSLFEKPAVILPIEKDFIVINYIKEKKVGYSIERYNESLEVVFSTKQIPDKKKLFPVDYMVKNGKIYVLEFKSPDFSDYFEYHIASFNASDCSEIYRNQIKDSDGKGSGYATFMRIDDNGRVYTGGMYFNGNRTKAANSDGFFASIIEPDGKMTSNYTDWKDVKSDLKGDNSVVWGGKTKTFMQDLSLNSDGSFTLIGENYRRGGADLAGEKKGAGKALGMASKVGRFTGSTEGEEDVAMTVSEFALFDFNPSGEFQSLRKVEKPATVTIIKSSTDPDEKPYVGQAKGLNLANILNNKGFFPYRFVGEKNGEKVIVYHLRYEPQVKELLYFTPLKAMEIDTSSIEITSEELRVVQAFQKSIVKKMGGLGKLASKASKVTGEDQQNEYILKKSDDPFDYRSKDLASRTILANIPGKIAMYDFVPKNDDSGAKKGSLASLMSGMIGSLKVWYVDIQ